MLAVPEFWSHEDEDIYKDLLIKKRVHGILSPEELKWIKESRDKRDELLSLRQRKTTRKEVEERLHYRWIEFYRKGIFEAAKPKVIGRTANAAWLILLDTELQALRDWRPLLTRAHTLRRHGFLGLRAEYVMRALHTEGSKPITLNKNIDKEIFKKEERSWLLLWEEKKNRCAEIFPVLSDEAVTGFRKEVIEETYRLTYESYPAFEEKDLGYKEVVTESADD